MRSVREASRFWEGDRVFIYGSGSTEVTLFSCFGDRVVLLRYF